MPTIEITQEQQDKLARGQSIMIDPPKQKRRYIAVFTTTGNVWQFDTDKEYAEIRNGYVTISGESTLLAAGARGVRSSEIVGTVRKADGRGGEGYLIEVPA
jgi:hypothetical protein